jgi:hypothetical protein
MRKAGGKKPPSGRALRGPGGLIRPAAPVENQFELRLTGPVRHGGFFKVISHA